MIFKKQEAEEEVKKNLDEAKRAVSGSESKEKLLEAVESLSNALNEAQKLRDLDDIKADLNGYRRYCDRACELLDSTEDKAPGATKLIRRGLPVIDDRIHEILAEIREKAEAVCRQSLGTSFEDLGKELNKAGQGLSMIREPIGLEKSVNNLENALSDICESITGKEKIEACKWLEQSKKEPYVEDKINSLNMILSKIPQLIDQIEQSAETISYNAEVGVADERTGFKAIIEPINPAATIAAFGGFIISEMLDVYPIEYNKHVISVIIAVVIFLIVFYLTRKGN